MGQIPRGPQRSERDRPSRVLPAVALVGAAAIASSVFWVLHLTDRPVAPTRSAHPAQSLLLVVARTAAGSPVRGLVGTLRIDRDPVPVTGAATKAGDLTFTHVATGSATLEVQAPGFARVRQQLLLSQGQRTLTLELAPGARLIVQVTDDRGTALPGALVDAWATSAEIAGVEFDTWSAITDAGGEAVLEGLPQASLSIGADIAGHEPATLTEIDPRQGDPCIVVLQRTARIEGQLAYKQDRSAAGGTVVIAGSGVWPPRRLEVGASGHFVIEGLAGGVYELHANSPGWVADPVEGITVDAGETTEATLLLAPAVRMHARVIDAATGRPISGAQVHVGESSLTFAAASVATNAAGEITVEGLRARPYRLSIQADGYVPLTSVEQVPSEVLVTHALVAAAEIRGQVVDAEGHPVVGAALEITGDAATGIPLAMTQGSLAFRAHLLSGSAAGPLPLMRSDNLGVTVGAIPRIPIASAFADHDTGDHPDNGRTQVALLGFTTDTSGHFVLTGVPPGSIELVVVQPGWALARGALIAVRPGARIAGIRIVLERGAQIAGKVVDSRGFPMPAVRVELECENDPTPRSTLTDDAGHYALTGALGRCSVTATPRDLPPSRISLQAANGAALELDLPIAAEAVRFQCSVLDSGGFPVVGAAVRVQGDDPAQPTSGASLSRADGSVEIDGLGAPPYRVEISHPDFAPLVIPSIAQPEGGRFVLLAGAVVRGTVLFADDRSPLTGARVELRSAADVTPRVSRTGPLGIFEIHNVIAGNYIINLLHPQTLASPRKVQVSERDVANGTVDLGEIKLAGAGSASGTVTDRLGVPVPGARVSAGTSAATTDSDGRFTVAGLMPGLVDVHAAHVDAGHAATAARVRVFAGQDTPGVRLQLTGRYVPAEETQPTATAAASTAASPPAVARVGVAIEVATVGAAVGIISVVGGSLAERAGLRPGDVIRAIDGEPVVIAGQARSLLRGSADTLATIDVTRGGQRRRFRARRERFVLPGPP